MKMVDQLALPLILHLLAPPHRTHPLSLPRPSPTMPLLVAHLPIQVDSLRFEPSVGFLKSSSMVLLPLRPLPPSIPPPPRLHKLRHPPPQTTWSLSCAPRKARPASPILRCALHSQSPTSSDHDLADHFQCHKLNQSPQLTPKHLLPF